MSEGIERPQSIEEEPEQPQKKKAPPAGTGVALGICFGAGIGLPLQNPVLGIAIGVAFAAAFEAAFKKQRDDENA